MGILRDNQLDIMLYICGICTALTILAFISKALTKRRRVALFLMEFSSLCLLLSDRLAYIYRGNTSTLGYVMVRVSNYLVFALSLFVIYTFNMVLKEFVVRVNENDKINSTVLRMVDSLLITGEAFILISQFTGMYYTFDESNRYQRGELFMLCYIFPLLSLILQQVVVQRERKKISKIMIWPLTLFTIVPLLATIAQFFFYGLSLTNISIVGIAMLLYIFSLIDLNDKISKANENEIRILKEEQELLASMFEETASALASAIDAKDEYTHGHSRRVARYSWMIAKMAGLELTECRKIYYAALLHDVGKIGIPDDIINKAGKLTKEEYEVVKLHTTIGSQILSSINSSPYLSLGAKYHHEWYDGSGYPEGLKGEEIPVMSRIIAVADAYDTMTSKRSYRDPLPEARVREEIINGLGSQFDPVFGKVMLDIMTEEADNLFLNDNNVFKPLKKAQ
ncbi:MAG: HD-GYP domain-containing protein [Lachnospira sp.]|nr:HD-GYP domain-containing protein [Lachnospira sp.]